MSWIIYLEMFKLVSCLRQLPTFLVELMKMEMNISVQQTMQHMLLLSLRADIIAQVNSSWAVRVNREDLLTIHVDGTEGSAVAGFRDCKIQHRVNTRKPVWNPDIENPFNFHEQWQEVPDNQIFDNGFKIQWELFLKAYCCRCAISLGFA